jgi:hypothetical protein
MTEMAHNKPAFAPLVRPLGIGVSEIFRSGTCYTQRERRVSHMETLVMEREEKSPYRGFGLIAALGIGASIWAGLIWAVLRMSS